MLSITEATIYLANQRGCSQEDWYRSYHTFNFGSYFSESRKSFGSLQVANDDTLKGGSVLRLHVKEDSLIYLLPIVGTLNYQNQLEQGRVEVGQCYHFFALRDSAFEISNPYENELINFLEIWIATESHDPGDIGNSEIDLDSNKNQLIPILTGKEKLNRKHAKAFIGKFEGRKESTFQLRNPEKGIFVFILEGVFEVQNRLLQSRDGLSLQNLKEVEFEALSNDAIILLLNV